MIWTEESIRSNLERYGEALGTGDLPTIVNSWEVPALVLSDEGARAVSTAAEIEQFFGASVAWYRAQGLVATRPHDVRIEALGQRLVSVDVRWSALDASGAEKGFERSRYILSIGEDGSPRIRVAISVTV
jgi:hypothetical protein